MTAEEFIARFAGWTSQQEEVLGAALIGSQARGTAREDSDIDLVMIVKDPSIWFNGDSWIGEFGKPQSIKLEDCGMVQSKRSVPGRS